MFCFRLFVGWRIFQECSPIDCSKMVGVQFLCVTKSGQPVVRLVFNVKFAAGELSCDGIILWYEASTQLGWPSLDPSMCSTGDGTAAFLCEK